uniref:protein-tyrosine-phosphatase n=1 Tax=Cyclopterus lumpus TaxID=8103 RepID=A0A8C2WNW5_CYCLU
APSVQPAMEQQSWILRDLLVQLERQEAVDEQAPNGIAGEFVRLKSQSIKYRTDKTYPTKTAEKQENNKKNRYKDIVPFDHTRVKLTLTTAKNDSEYINASFIKGVSGSRAYIATQGPLPHTVLDFLRMLWEYDIKVVIMACREFEMGKKKCERYWPQKQEQSFFCEPFTVFCDSEENKGDYLTRTLRVNYQNCSRTLKQLHYFNWPDHGVPDSIPPILDMLHEMRSYQAHDDVPFCIHCSAGCGRTGVLCVIDYTWNLLKTQMITPDFNIYDLVQNMRTQRPSVVQTKEQYELVYRTIKLLFERYLQAMDAQTCGNEVTTVPSSITTDTEGELSDLSEKLDLLPQFLHLLDEGRDVVQQYPTPLTSASENHIALRAKDLPRDQEQWHLLRTLPEALTTTQDPQEGPKAPLTQVHTSQRAPAVEERMKESDDIASLNPPSSPAVAVAICLMVEDPYFDTPMSSPSSEEAPMDLIEGTKQWTVSPIVTTVSLCLNDQTLELNSLASGKWLYQCIEIIITYTPTQKEDKLIPCYLIRNKRYFIFGCAAEESLTPPLPDRTPESFILTTEEIHNKTVLCPQPLEATRPSPRVGLSSEWDGNAQPKKFLDVVMSRSKSVRAKGSRQGKLFDAMEKDCCAFTLTW